MSFWILAPEEEEIVDELNSRVDRDHKIEFFIFFWRSQFRAFITELRYFS